MVAEPSIYRCPASACVCIVDDVVVNCSATAPSEVLPAGLQVRQPQPILRRQHQRQRQDGGALFDYDADGKTDILEKKMICADNKAGAARIGDGERGLAATPLMWERQVGSVGFGGWQRPLYQTGPTVFFAAHRLRDNFRTSLRSFNLLSQFLQLCLHFLLRVVAESRLWPRFRRWLSVPRWEVVPDPVRRWSACAAHRAAVREGRSIRR